MNVLDGTIVFKPFTLENAMKNWAELASTSHYQTAVEVRQELYAGNMQEAIMGVTELIDALTRSDKRALQGQLVRLMKHILKWKLSPEYRTVACSLSILESRREISNILEDTPALNTSHIEDSWQQVFDIAVLEAEIETGHEPTTTLLSWAEVFDNEYALSRLENGNNSQ